MGIKELKELRIKDDGKISLEGKTVNVNPIGKPISVEWCSPRANSYRNDFYEMFDESYRVPSKADSFIKSDTLYHISEHRFSMAVQFYKIQE